MAGYRCTDRPAAICPGTPEATLGNIPPARGQHSTRPGGSYSEERWAHSSRSLPLAGRTHYYQALVDTVLHILDPQLGDRGRIFGYRAIRRANSPEPFGEPLQQWKQFRRTVKRVARSGQFGAVVRTDIASYFERIQHHRLGSLLEARGVRPEVVKELKLLLVRLMDGATMGLPQGSDPSSVLATTYLDPVDKVILRRGHEFYIC